MEDRINLLENFVDKQPVRVLAYSIAQRFQPKKVESENSQLAYSVAQIVQSKKIESEINYFTLLPSELWNMVLDSMMAENSENSQSLFCSLVSLTSLAKTNKYWYEEIRSDRHLESIKKKLLTIKMGDVFIETQQLIDDNKEKIPVLKCLKKMLSPLVQKIQYIYALMSYVNEVNDDERVNFSVFDLLRLGLKPTFLVADKCKKDGSYRTLFSCIDFHESPEKALELLQNDPEISLEGISNHFFMRGNSNHTFTSALLKPLKKKPPYSAYKDLFKKLIERGLDPNHRFNIGINSFPLLVLVVNYFQEDKELLDLLLERGANPYEEFVLIVTPDQHWTLSSLTYVQKFCPKTSESIELFKKYKKI